MRHGWAISARARESRSRRWLKHVRMLAPVLVLMVLAAGACALLDEVPSASVNAHAVAITSGALQVVDGDTVRFRGERLRLLTIDAPEIWSPRCPAEYSAGIAAKSELRDFLLGRLVTVHYSGRRDVYRRPLVKLSVDGKDAGRHLLEKGLAIRYAWGKWIKGVYWCGWW